MLVLVWVSPSWGIKYTWGRKNLQFLNVIACHILETIQDRDVVTMEESYM